MDVDYSTEAIQERDPAYELPHGEGTEEAEQTMSQADAFRWDEMVKMRPALACLRRLS
jgi:hypothetical protein